MAKSVVQQNGKVSSIMMSCGNPGPESVRSRQFRMIVVMPISPEYRNPAAKRLARRPRLGNEMNKEKYRNTKPQVEMYPLALSAFKGT
ncbi:hypothetical protein E4U43_006483 [Claviceps pusilla]|uniref:Uncharacterized protein n=1 Tax=Claviceps pusilla TaxID=123648 RepID=A0A9P7NFM7_9HYPO|nr:hypothetical protein E4U43_006483 [Claviceps pusilla]